MGVCSGSAQTVVTQDLGLRRDFAKIVPRMLTDRSDAAMAVPEFFVFYKGSDAYSFFMSLRT